MVFNYVNAWEDKNEKGEDIIVLFGCPQENVNIDFEEEHPFLGNEHKHMPVLAKFVFNLATGEATMDKCFGNMACEFPVID